MLAEGRKSDEALADRTKAISLADVAVLLGLPVLGAVSWLLPERAWDAFGRACVPFYMPAQGGHASLVKIERGMAALLGNHAIGAGSREVLEQLVAEDIVSFLQLLRDYRPAGWRPVIDIVGREHIDMALASGRGAILWVGFFVHAKLVTKLAFHRAGVAVSHLSHPRHGISESRFGMSWLNRLMTAAEDRYLAERVMLSDANPVRAMQHLRRRLEANGVVSISVRNARRGAQAAPLFDGRIEIATGAPGLAAKTGAALLPVFPVRQADGGFSVFVEAPLEIDANARRDAAAVMAQYGALLQRYILDYPGQWLGWLHL